MATTKKRAKRPPRQVWLVVNARGTAYGPHATKREASEDCAELRGISDDGERVVGPYVLAERVRER